MSIMQERTRKERPMKLALVKDTGKDWKVWADRINGSWQKGVESIIETGLLLLDAKEGPNKLPHGSFQNMVQMKLAFDQRMAQKLMKIAKNPSLTKSAHCAHLPPSADSLVVLAEADSGLINNWI